MNRDEAEFEFDQAAKLLRDRQYHGRYPKTIGNMVGRVITKHGVSSEQANEELENAWIRVVGNRWDRLTKVGSVKRGKLEVTVANSMVNQQLTFEKKTLLAGIQRELAHMKITDLLFRVGQVPNA